MGGLQSPRPALGKGTLPWKRNRVRIYWPCSDFAFHHDPWCPLSRVRSTLQSLYCSGREPKPLPAIPLVRRRSRRSHVPSSGPYRRTQLTSFLGLGGVSPAHRVLPPALPVRPLTRVKQLPAFMAPSSVLFRVMAARCPGCRPGGSIAFSSACLGPVGERLPVGLLDYLWLCRLSYLYS